MLIVLVRPSHPGNIGAAARAMKTMGLTQLALVAPSKLPDAEAYARATHAKDILDNCQIFPDLTSALAECTLVIGTSARPRSLEHVVLNPKQLAATCAQEQVAILFGNERTGLDNTELSFCHKLVHIPSNPNCSSLNLAAAVQIICYELTQLKPSKTPTKASNKAATTAELQNFYEHLGRIIEQTNFIKATTQANIMQQLTCLFQRAAPSANEIAIFRGLLTSIERKL